MRCLTPTLGGSLRVCGSNDTHLRDDTAKYLGVYIKIAASLEKKKKKRKQMSLPDLTFVVSFSLNGLLLSFQ